MKRVVTPELLDEDLGTPEEIRRTLLDLRGFNQNFGGFRSALCLFVVCHGPARSALLRIERDAGSQARDAIQKPPAQPRSLDCGR